MPEVSRNSVRDLIKCFEAMKHSGETYKSILNIPRIIVDDFDSSNKEPKRQNSHSTGPTPRIYTRSYSDASIKKMLEEAEHRKHEFWKLLDEHNAVIENLKRIEKLEHKII
ncbi:unnamed protein product [Ceutorhynchus assimilis]|uniref:Uncharacterized protein n=1 Tax=Ceutorhynchus assimilis TaxID=467358 RepID=A0A9N9QK99_9CUCU|nr:unnamed protein product [Ceutorhynchus assimilis]